MPRDRVAKLLSTRRQVVSLADVLLLESSFRVSFQSAAIRVIETAQDHICAGVMWRPDGGVWYVIALRFGSLVTRAFFVIEISSRPMCDAKMLERGTELELNVRKM